MGEDIGSKIETYEISVVAFFFIVFAVLLPLAGLTNLFLGTLLLIFLVVVGVMFSRLYSGGNISKYISKLRLLWHDIELSKDISYDHMARNLTIASIIECTSIIVFMISLYFLGGLPGLTIAGPSSIEAFAAYTDLFTLSFVIMVLSFIFIIIMTLNMLMKKAGTFAPRGLIVYDQGIRILNRFIPWSDIESINRPNHYRYYEGLSKIPIFFSSLLSNHGFSHLKYPLYKIIERNNRVYIVPLSDISGLKNTLQKCRQAALLK